MSNPPRYIAVVDYECTCSNTNAGDDTVARSEMEIIEIGAVMLRRHDFEPVDSFPLFVRPVVHAELTDFCTELTSITQDDVALAPLFPKAFDRFCSWLERWETAEWGSWGNFDAYQLQLDAQRHGIEYELARLPAHVNVKKWWAQRMNMKRVGLGRAVQTAGLEWEGRAHRGIDDARMIARLLPGVGWPRIPQGAEIRPVNNADDQAIAAQRAQAEEDRRIESEGTDAEREELRRRKSGERERVVDWRPSSSEHGGDGDV